MPVFDTIFYLSFLNTRLVANPNHAPRSPDIARRKGAWLVQWIYRALDETQLLIVTSPFTGDTAEEGDSVSWNMSRKNISNNLCSSHSVLWCHNFCQRTAASASLWERNCFWKQSPKGKSTKFNLIIILWWLNSYMCQIHLLTEHRFIWPTSTSLFSILSPLWTHLSFL